MKDYIVFMNDKLNNIVKAKVIQKDGYNYTLELSTGKRFIKNIEVYNNIKIEINDNIYILNSTLYEDNMLQFGKIVNNKDEIIKIIRNEEEYYLQRYYG